MPIPSGVVPASRVILADVLYERLLDAVVSGATAPGEKLSDAKVAEWAGMSRTPVREALDRLARIHLVEVLPRRGTLVTAVDPVRSRDSLEALGPVLVETLRSVVRLGSEEERAALADAFRDSVDAIGLFAGDGPLAVAVRQLRNERTEQVWADLVPYLRRAWNLDPALRVDGLSERIRTDVAASVRTGAADAAAEALDGWFAAQAVDRSETSPDEVVERPALAEPVMLREHAFETLYTAIVDGTLEPGEELDEKALIRWLDMSRQPIRHALLRLAAYGLVDMVPNRQPRVALLDPARVTSTLFVSTAWNVFTIERTAGRLADDEAEAVAAIATAYAEAVAADDTIGTATALRQFFAVFVDAFGNSVIAEQNADISYELALFLRPGGSAVDLGSIGQAFDAITAAVVTRDAAAAADAARTLVRLSLENFEARRQD